MSSSGPQIQPESPTGKGQVDIAEDIESSSAKADDATTAEERVEVTEEEVRTDPAVYVV